MFQTGLTPSFWTDSDSSDPRAELVEYTKHQQLTQEFHHEVRYRKELDEYCQWYDQVAATHRAELADMQRDINFLGWFVKR